MQCSTLLSKWSITVRMGRKKDLTVPERSQIVRLLSKGIRTVEISKKLGRDHRTIQRFIQNTESKRTRADKGSSRTVSARELRSIRRQTRKNPLASSKTVFEKAGLGHIPRTSRCRILQTVAHVKKSSKRPPLTKTHKEKRLVWAETYMKCDFPSVLFPDECRATLDGLNGWCSGWKVDGTLHPHD